MHKEASRSSFDAPLLSQLLFILEIFVVPNASGSGGAGRCHHRHQAGIQTVPSEVVTAMKAEGVTLPDVKVKSTSALAKGGRGSCWLGGFGASTSLI